MGLRSLREGLVGTWIALQVELHGHYSVKRLVAFKIYKSTTSSIGTFSALLLSLVPCIAVVVMIDLPHLSNPGDGLATSHVLWFRASTATALIAFMLLQQMRTLLPDLGIRQIQIVVITALVTVAATAWALGLASIIGYPLPFTFAAGSPMFMTVLSSSVWILWGKTFARSPRLRQQLKQYFLVVIVQWALTLIYPIFNFVFLQVGPIGQTALAVVLPVVKILMKYWLAILLENASDVQPQFVIFNVEVFHALFVAFCMQNAVSIWTSISIMALDALHAWASIHDIDIQLNKLSATLRGTDGGEKANPPDNHSLELLPLVDSTVYLLCCPNVLESFTAKKPVSRLESLRTIGLVVSRGFASTSVVPIAAGSTTKPLEPPRVESSKYLAMLSDLPVQLTDGQKRILDNLTPDQQTSFVHDALALLHMTEFLLLVEYVEVVIPIIYCVYLVVIYHLPNRKYYPQLQDMDSARMTHVIQNMLLYAGLELLSFVALDWVLRRKMHFRPLRQLTFVLSTQWFIVQAKLILWLVYMVQASLDHFGADYSFQFKWLGNSTYFD